ncbi:MAG: ribonuclease HII, partial [Oscillospiraceae bacterium]|nr:ribonuclease HII [Oscillospiraceae bacterium]
MIYEELFEYDDIARSKAGGALCGCDEAGRGPLAGPVCCAAVVLAPEDRFEWLTDSKKVSEKRRESLYEQITLRALAYSVVFIDNKRIDEINILRASLEGMRQA